MTHLFMNIHIFNMKGALVTSNISNRNENEHLDAEEDVNKVTSK